jgi:hypothetical protein
MTRHDLVLASAAGFPPPATKPRVSVANIAADSVATSLVRDRLDCAKSQRSGLSATTTALPIFGRAIADIGRNSKSP